MAAVAVEKNLGAQSAVLKGGIGIRGMLEIAINWLELYKSFEILLLGRVLGGISTNLLFSAFESWMATEHRKKGFPEEWMARTYSEVSVYRLFSFVGSLYERSEVHLM